MKVVFVFTAAAVVSLMISGVARAHGTVGQRLFIEPIVADDANPKNEFDILRPFWTWNADGRNFSLGFAIEKKVSENGSVSVGSSWNEDSPKAGPYASGFDDLFFKYKYSFLTLTEHELRLSAAINLQ